MDSLDDNVDTSNGIDIQYNMIELYSKMIYFTLDMSKLIFFFLYNNGKKVSLESERYQECLFGYSDIVHAVICTFTLVFSHGNKYRAGQGAP